MSDILSQIRKCDENKPYIFVSYSSLDKDVVHRDVLEFQKRGYNVWLDEKNLDKRKPSWKADALSAIEQYECKLVVYYVGTHSLVSEACLNEMRATKSSDTVMYHNGEEVEFIAVETEEIGNLIKYKKQIFTELQEKKKDEIDKAEKAKDENAIREAKEQCDKKVRTLSVFIEEFFMSNNERVRVKPNSTQRQLPYYEDIIRSFPKETRIGLPEKEKASVTVATTPQESPKAEPVVIQAPVKEEKVKEGQEVKPETQEASEGTTKKKKHAAVNVKKGEKRPEVRSYPATITRDMTLSEFEALFTDVQFVLHIAYLREHGDFIRQIMDYVMSALLRGCDIQAAEQSARWNYCTYAVATLVDMSNPDIGASQFTWQSNSRKAVNISGSGKLGPNSVIFENLSADLTLGDVEQMFKDRKEGFDTKDNSAIERVFAALYNIK